MALVDEVEDFLPRALHRHAMEIEASLSGIASLLQFSIDTVLNTRTLEFQGVPRVQRLDAIVGQWIAVSAKLGDRGIPAAPLPYVTALRAIHTYLGLNLQRFNVGHLAEKIFSDIWQVFVYLVIHTGLYVGFPDDA